MKKLLTLSLGVMMASQASARTFDEVLAAGGSDSKLQGLEIAKEADARDEGYISSENASEMILRNAQGQESIRNMRNQNFEMIGENVGDKSIIVFDRPKDVEGTAFLTHSKVLEADDQWMYLPALKRVKRINSKNKSGPFMGSEFAYEDISSQEVGKYTYNYLRTEPCPTDAALTCAVMERFPEYKHSGYVKQIGWLDTEEFRPQQIEFYDLKGDLMKTLKYSGYQQYLNKFWRAGQMDMVNNQNGKSTTLKLTDYKFRTGLQEDDFTKAKLKNVR